MMPIPTIDLMRLADGKYGTFGVLRQEFIPFAVTLEPPWKGNYPFESCIPASDYFCRRTQSQKFGETFEVLDVRDRSMVLFHKGNTEEDTEGCIVVGEQFDPVNGKPGVRASGKGFSEFMSRLQGHDKFWLRVMWRT